MTDQTGEPDDQVDPQQADPQQADPQQAEADELDVEQMAVASSEGPTAADEPTSGQGAAEDPAAQALAERTADLQRLQAEFVNYKRRVERDREMLKENARYEVLTPIVEVLDTIDRARDSAEKTGGELSGDLKTVAEQLERTVEKSGLAKFGEPGDAFDPMLHEALSHLGTDDDVETTTVKVVAKAGYRINDRVVRAAQVLVVDPA